LYCRLMIISTLLQLIESYVGVVMMSLDHNSFIVFLGPLSSFGIYFPVLYVSLIKYHLGLKAIVLASMAFYSFRLLMWFIYIKISHLEYIIRPIPGTAWTTKAGRTEFLHIAPWLIIDELSVGSLTELMFLLLWKIKDVPESLLAYAALWMELMYFFGAVKEGLVWATFHRTIGLIYKGDPNSKTVFWLNLFLSTMTVLVLNIIVLGSYGSLGSLLTNNEEQNAWGKFLVWTLVLHVQIMVMNECSSSILKGINKASLCLRANVFTSYAIAVPLVLTFMWSDSISVPTKACICLCTCTIAKSVSLCIFCGYTHMMRWKLLVQEKST